MLIADIDYSELEDLETADLVVTGGRRRGNTTTNDWSSFLQPLLQSLTIYPASAAAVNNLGGTSIGNTAISVNIVAPIMIAINGWGAGSSPWGRGATR